MLRTTEKLLVVNGFPIEKGHNALWCPIHSTDFQATAKQFICHPNVQEKLIDNDDSQTFGVIDEAHYTLPIAGYGLKMPGT